MTDFTHIDKDGRVRMVDVGDKAMTKRVAVVAGRISMEKGTLARIMDEKVKKGNVLETARIAGVMAAKRTSDLIPMCHPLNISHARVDFAFDVKNCAIDIEAEVSLTGKTGVEMEALTAASVAALTIYDMCKSYDRAMRISNIYLKSKSGGKSGTYTAK
ncbi:MAG: cyclic pyranopterin monophosphate synthase MoaC [Desulfobacula sp.]|jgi:cyclic pyranopterin phosphate synthase|uniref:cyclic pyranopterin monophosphate synthase MoaC n=1 Tax=Desulfobacula sp. TaxID=2593537 RepID=UPI001D547EE4|nr:cyclic pyranopterin monophosphate synthase MoaC [Desulfobacula sp.]MBT3485037.1 cyclic pyranopterin monophosphate synthase MoaC [Desulfobacula sp.]MBT3804146.1 cyclic pyranopterin monophosphate synthase MoaC [Desulfobacula sp.]MBT4025002.1 cyclic pyranopterin monophosphate synthase MoaC [Desulfobacula sp.]MBT4198688.1 cyclic pyranopterin monophosphate synthase MoaC [Desulfobacula sp.]